jgi:HEAT repeat protein
MDIFSIFQRSPEKQIQRLRKKVKEPHGDPSVRINAAQRLFEMDSAPALRALLDRFTINVSPSAQDEREKAELSGWLVRKGKGAVPALLSYLKNERAVYWPARVLRQILEEEEFGSRFDEVLRFHWENPPASAYPKAQLIRSLEGTVSSQLDDTIRLFLEDDDDDVRLAAIEYLLNRSEEESREPILECYLESEDRPRVRRQILEHLVEKGWHVRGFRPAVEETLPDNFVLTRDGKVRQVGN